MHIYKLKIQFNMSSLLLDKEIGKYNKYEAI